MNILSITAQKPDSTGSGVYLTELVKGFDSLGHKQAVIAGIYREDQMCLPPSVIAVPVYFHTEELPFPIPGMSDEMPYQSTIYGNMSSNMVTKMKQAFSQRLYSVVKSFQPDLIVCHHLYLLTAWVRELCPNVKIVAVCHGTDLRQMKRIQLEQAYIRTQIQQLDGIFALHENQKKEICQVYQVRAEQIFVLGSGYNSQIFRGQANSQKRPIRLIYAGKLSYKKGIFSLIQALQHLPYGTDELILSLAGGSASQEEMDRLSSLIAQCPYQVRLLGKLTQQKLALAFCDSHLFVLPSFYEGLPLVLLEAMACGLKVVCSDLPGVKQWMDEHVPGHGIHMVTLPDLVSADEPIVSQLPDFEIRLARQIATAIEEPNRIVDLSDLSWHGVCQRLLACLYN